MAGVKGRSGGRREGAGRKPKVAASINGDTPLEILMRFAQDPELPVDKRIKAAGLAAPYIHGKPGAGKKDAAQAGAEAEAGGEFAPKAAPKLVVNNA